MRGSNEMKDLILSEEDCDEKDNAILGTRGLRLKKGIPYHDESSLSIFLEPLEFVIGLEKCC